MTMRGGRMVAGMLMLAIVGSPASASRSPAPRPPDLVQIHVVVEDAQGKLVHGLGPNDFVVLVDGFPATIAAVAIDPAPLSVVLLIDVTASMHLCPGGVAGIPSTARVSTGSSFPEPIPPAVEPFVLYGVGGNDRVRVGAIGRRLVLDDGFRTGANDIRRRWRAMFDLPPIDWLGPSAIWDAVAAATTAVASEPGHRAVVLVSDGAATGNARSRREVSEAAARAGVPISVVAEEAVTRLPASASGEAVDPSDGLLALADETGGVAVLDKAVADDQPLRKGCFKHQSELALQVAFDHLHQSYAISFASFADGSRQPTLDVRVNGRGLKVTAAPKTCPVTRRNPS